MKEKTTNRIVVLIFTIVIVLSLVVGLGGEYVRAWVWGKALGFKSCECGKQP